MRIAFHSQHWAARCIKERSFIFLSLRGAGRGKGGKRQRGGQRVGYHHTRQASIASSSCLRLFSVFLKAYHHITILIHAQGRSIEEEDI